MRNFLLVLATISVSTTSYAALNLDDAVRSTLQINESVGQSRQRLRQSEEMVKQAKGAIMPSIALNGTHLMQPKPTDPIAAAFFPEHQTTASLSLTQPLFRGFREFAGLRRQDDLYDMERQTHYSSMMALYQQVASSYLDVLALEQDLRNIEAQKIIYRDRVKDLQARAHRGESSASETLTAQSTAAALEAEFQVQNSKLKAARQNFSLLTGLKAEESLVDIGEDAASLPPLETFLARVEERPDIKALKSRVEAAGEDVSIARGAHWPTLDFVGNYYLIRPEGFMKDIKWDLQLKLTFPLFEGGATESKVRTAASLHSESDLALHQQRRKAEAEIRSLHEALRLRADQLKALKQASDISERNYQVLVRDSRRGLVRSIDVQLGLTEYRQAKRSYDQARYQAHLERIQLNLATAIVPAVLASELR